MVRARITVIGIDIGAGGAAAPKDWHSGQQKACGHTTSLWHRRQFVLIAQA
jgi:hypothetical protein